MKVTIIHGQNHRESSYHAGRCLLEQLEPVEAIYEFFLPKDMPEFCLGCYQCMIKSEKACPHYRYLEVITNAILQSDLLIFTTPVYVMHTSGSMKALLDHYFTWWMNHRPKETMFYKKAVIISAGAGAGMKKAIRDIQTSLSYWGISDIQTYGFRSQAMRWEDVTLKNRIKLQKQLKIIANHIEKHQNQRHVSLRIKFIFMMMRMSQLKGWSACQKDDDYWKEKGWLEKKRPWSSYE